ncbi:MAG: DUF4430 domain-containing protein [Lachnospiraceae bacterium]|nr:DUF4430 domain-containing protein [Lachnospiraceae bacterium]
MNRKKLTAVVLTLLAALVVVFGCIFFFLSAKPTGGSKRITIEVVNMEEKSTVYKVQTDAEFLRQAMEEAKGLEFSGTEGSYGMMVETINGETADYNATGNYWAFYVNDKYCNYGVDSQPVTDGDQFKIVYE